MWNYEAEEAKAVVVIVHGAMEYHGRYEASCRNVESYRLPRRDGRPSITWNNFKK